jgi:CheY-like chemotaxis protein
VLIVENDLSFAKIVLQAARERGFKGVVTSLGAAALALTRDFKPSAITLDICLPDIDGWRVLARLKHDLDTRHIPVYIMSTEEDQGRGRALGAVDALLKPIQTTGTLEESLERLKQFALRKRKRVLLLGADEARQRQARELLEGPDLELVAAASGAEALELLKQTHDCAVLASPLADLPLEELLERASRGSQNGQTPLLVYDPSQSSEQDVAEPREQQHDGVLLKRVYSPERLLDQVALYSHRPVAALPAERRRLVEQLHRSDVVLAGKKVLVVDDDIRNIFALTSVLERHQLEVLSAETGRDAIRILQEVPDVDLVLMDIMMPEMDGIDTMREIRKIPRLGRLPIVAVTAKAMKGDRERCLEAGAWDYLSKPVDCELLLGVLRCWLHQ